MCNVIKSLSRFDYCVVVINIIIIIAVATAFVIVAVCLLLRQNLFSNWTFLEMLLGH